MVATIRLFKVGDKIQVREKKDWMNYLKGSARYNGALLKYAGRKGIITNIDRSHYCIDIDETNRFAWWDEDLIPYDYGDVTNKVYDVLRGL